MDVFCNSDSIFLNWGFKNSSGKVLNKPPELKVSCLADTMFMFDPQILQQVKQWQALLHQQTEIFLAQPDLGMWHKAWRRTHPMPF